MILSWSDVQTMVATGPRGVRVYGVPRGGSIIAALLTANGCTPVEHAESADVIVDDIVDSGETRARYHASHPGKPFWAACAKPDDGRWVVFPWESDEPAGAEANVTRLLQSLGENPRREGLLETPRRVVKAMREMTSGYSVDVDAVLAVAFSEQYDEMIVVRDIPFWSLCEHHLLPFHGQATVGYIPDGRVVGLSKIPRLVHAFARRLQVQERMTQQIASTLLEKLHPIGAGCVVTAAHTCMASRGIGVQAPMVTSCLLGAMRTGQARDEFFHCAKVG